MLPAITAREMNKTVLLLIVRPMMLEKEMKSFPGRWNRRRRTTTNTKD
ncbi:hypothetical protein [Shimazuella kribbensis]|nr:hypothetical protein [Shimazuella kribbensis]